MKYDILYEIVFNIVFFFFNSNWYSNVKISLAARKTCVSMHCHLCSKVNSMEHKIDFSYTTKSYCFKIAHKNYWRISSNFDQNAIASQSPNK